jgi:hypothetical protein
VIYIAAGGGVKGNPLSPGRAAASFLLFYGSYKFVANSGSILGAVSGASHLPFGTPANLAIIFLAVWAILVIAAILFMFVDERRRQLDSRVERQGPDRFLIPSALFPIYLALFLLYMLGLAAAVWAASVLLVGSILYHAPAWFAGGWFWLVIFRGALVLGLILMLGASVSVVMNPLGWSWRVLMTPLPYAGAEHSTARWQFDFYHAKPAEQARMMRRLRLRTKEKQMAPGFEPIRFRIKLLESVELLIKEEPALSVHCQVLCELENLAAWSNTNAE